MQNTIQNSEISFSKDCYWTVLFNWKCGRNSGTSHHLHCFLVFTWYIQTINMWLSGIPFVVLTHHKGFWSWVAGSGKRCWVGCPPMSCVMRMEGSEWDLWLPRISTPGLHWAAAFPGSAFICSLGASSIVELQMDCQTPGESKMSGWFWVL